MVLAQDSTGLSKKSSQIISPNRNRTNTLIHFMRPQLLIPIPHKDPTKKENYRPAFFRNIDGKFLIKHLQTKSRNTLKTSSTMINLASQQRCRNGSTYKNQLI